MIRLFVPGKIWTVNAERSGSVWTHRRHTADLREAARLVGLQARVRSHGLTAATVRVRPTQTRQGGTLADVAAHLPAAKAVIDGLIDAGLLPDDDPKHLHSITFLPPVRADKGRPTGIALNVLPV